MIYIWIAAIVIFVIIELLTPQMVSIWFAAAAAAGLIALLAGAPLWLQLLLFVLVSLILVVLTRPIYKKYFIKKVIPTNYDALIGKEAVVTESIDNISAKGQVQIMGQIWSARAEGDETIDVNEKVLVEKIEGVKLIVKKI